MYALAKLYVDLDVTFVDYLYIPATPVPRPPTVAIEGLARAPCCFVQHGIELWLYCFQNRLASPIHICELVYVSSLSSMQCNIALMWIGMYFATNQYQKLSFWQRIMMLLFVF